MKFAWQLGAQPVRPVSREDSQTMQKLMPTTLMLNSLAEPATCDKRLATVAGFCPLSLHDEAQRSPGA